MLNLKSKTSKEWVEKVLADFDAFLIDHAACERKVSAANMQFVVRYPDRTPMLDTMIKMAVEELDHFHKVYQLMEKRNLKILPDTKDEYINLILKNVRETREEKFLDRLLVSSVVEARGCERMALVAEAVEDQEIKDFYTELVKCEARHHSQFIIFAKMFFDEELVKKRLEDFLTYEAEAIAKVPVRAALY